MKKRIVVRTSKSALPIQAAVKALERMGCEVDVFQGPFHRRDIKNVITEDTHIKDLPIGTAFKMDRKRRVVTVQIPYEQIDDLDLVRARGLPLDTGSRVILRSHLMILQQNVFEAQRGVTELLDLVDGKKPVQKKRRKR